MLKAVVKQMRRIASPFDCTRKYHCVESASSPVTDCYKSELKTLLFDILLGTKRADLIYTKALYCEAL